MEWDGFYGTLPVRFNPETFHASAVSTHKFRPHMHVGAPFCPRPPTHPSGVLAAVELVTSVWWGLGGAGGVGEAIRARITTVQQAQEGPWGGKDKERTVRS